ncbi:MAG: DoxX family protein [Flavobacteriaceae bacterium]|nr:DoxX family protein [Flavobacteriaceae bacterium]MCY4217180.1 DoxX family protein [Flavobacteriaceae bacterium]MCY4254364.1 DoxX family protein [Flavobacteriaceae bacterium]
MKKNTDLALLIIRVVFSVAMITHGWGKISKVFQGDFAFADPIGIGAELTLVITAIGEFIAPILIIVGYQTRWAAALTTLVMLGAMIAVHMANGDAFDRWEKALLFFTGFLAIALAGGGKYSLKFKRKP